MKKIFIVSIIASLFLISLVSAMKIDFYYHPECSHCKNVVPIIQNLMNQYKEPCYMWKVIDTSQPYSYAISGVPTIKIITSDNRNIEIVGDAPILKQLPCELAEQSTKECMTYPGGEGTRGGSWFRP
jgi:thiol-disulfide isomerase/thioredoxin